jgi:uncharacterized phiE125 gp8 family phage protein
MERLEPKAPSEVRNYSFDWSTFLGTDTIATSTVTVVGVTKDSDTHDSSSVTVKVSGGADGTAAEITNTITTAGGLTETELFILPISDSSEPVSVIEARTQVNVTDDTFDAYLASLIPAARRYVENRSGIIIKQRQFTERQFPVRGSILLNNGPLVSVEDVTYPDTDGVDASYSDARFFAGSSLIYPALGATWPTPYPGEGFTVTYTAGLSVEELATDDYSNLVHAVKLLIGHWFNQREGVSVDQRPPAQVPLTVDDLCDQVRAIV